MRFGKVFALLGLMTLCACMAAIDTKGHSPEDVTEVPAVGASADDVRGKLGSPSSRTAFGGETWYYISAKRQNRALLPPKTLEQQVLAVHFAGDGTVASTEQYSLKDGKRVDFAKAATPTEGHSLGFLEQIVGNIGRFNKQEAAQ